MILLKKSFGFDIANPPWAKSSKSPVYGGIYKSIRGGFK